MSNEENNPNQDQPENQSEQTNEQGNASFDDIDPTRLHIRDKKPAELFSGIFDFIRKTLSLRNHKYQYDAVLTDVQSGITFEGYNVWILICSIVVASVGLNMDSMAVVIGAMLISPLMGPIRGMGFGIAMNDFKLLLDSLKNFGVLVAISLTTSFLYFLATPIHAETPELLGRTEPNFLDVVIAFFGGLAGVIAMSRGKNDTVINGVAIATALMPPLCTAGYGLANGNWSFFFGASYLFLINSMLIALSTIVLIRYLKFPKKEYLSPKIEKRVKTYITVFLIVVIAPSGWLFYRMTKRSIFESNADLYVKEVILKTDENIEVTTHYQFDWDNSVIELSIDNFYADQFVIEMWSRQLDNYELEDARLRIKQDQDIDAKLAAWEEDYNNRNQGANTLAELLSDRENDIVKLREEIEKLENNPVEKKDPIDFSYLLESFKIDYPELDKIYINRSFSLNKKNSLDTSYVMTIGFNRDYPVDQYNKTKTKISKRFLFELKEKTSTVQDSVQVIILR